VRAGAASIGSTNLGSDSTAARSNTRSSQDAGARASHSRRCSLSSASSGCSTIAANASLAALTSATLRACSTAYRASHRSAACSKRSGSASLIATHTANASPRSTRGSSAAAERMSNRFPVARPDKIGRMRNQHHPCEHMFARRSRLSRPFASRDPSGPRAGAGSQLAHPTMRRWRRARTKLDRVHAAGSDPSVRSSLQDTSATARTPPAS
jgi:hypothetical protein